MNLLRQGRAIRWRRLRSQTEMNLLRQGRAIRWRRLRSQTEMNLLRQGRAIRWYKCAARSPLNGPRAPRLISAPPREQLGQLSQIAGLSAVGVKLNSNNVMTKADEPRPVLISARPTAHPTASATWPGSRWITAARTVIPFLYRCEARVLERYGSGPSASA